MMFLLLLKWWLLVDYPDLNLQVETFPPLSDLQYSMRNINYLRVLIEQSLEIEERSKEEGKDAKR